MRRFVYFILFCPLIAFSQGKGYVNALQSDKATISYSPVKLVEPPNESASLTVTLSDLASYIEIIGTNSESATIDLPYIQVREQSQISTREDANKNISQS